MAGTQDENQTYDECQSGDDLFLQPARRIIHRLMADFFVKQKVTVTEALHRTDILSKLENAGTVMQHATQKIAVARSASDGTPVSETIKRLDKLTSEVYARVFNDRKNDVFPSATAEQFGALATKLAGDKNGTYLLNGALATFLRDGANWNEKTVRLARLAEMHRDEPGSTLLHTAIDEILAEILHMPSALQDIIGEKEFFGDALMTLLHLFLGEEQIGQYGEGQGLARLARLFASGDMPVAHYSLGCRIVAEIYSLKRLRTDSYDAELKLFKHIAATAAQCNGEHINLEKMTAALEFRASRFVEPECITECLASTILPDEKIEWLLFAADCIVGTKNKLAYFNAITRILSSAVFANQFKSVQIPVLKRLHRLGALNALARRSGLAPELRQKIANILDVRASDIATQARVFESIDGRQADAAEKAVLLIKLFSAGTFTEPRLADKARETIVGYVSHPGFLPEYIDHKLRTSGDELDDASAKKELTEILTTIGVPPDACVKAIAA